MHSLVWFSAVVLLGITLGFTPPAEVGRRPDEPNLTLPTTQLFDGRTVDGWKVVSGSQVGAVTVVDGSMILATGNPMTGVTTTRTELPTTNYRLTFAAKRLEGNDFFAAATFPVGTSFVTLINGGWGGSVTGLSLINGDNAAENVTNRFVRYQNNIWYRYEIQVTARIIRCLIDDVEVVAYPHEGAQLSTRLETRSNQPLGFATYRSVGAIRQIELKPLTAAEIAAAEAKVKID